MKFLILCALLAVASSTLLPFNEKEAAYLASLNFEDLPKQIQDIIIFDKLKLGGDNSHWCCTNEQPVNTVQRTKVIKETHTVATKVKTGYTACGFNGWMMCSTYETRYKQVTEYHIQTYEVPDEQACADHHVKCCKDFFLVAENCVDIATLSANLDLFQALVSMGLIASVGK